MTLPRFIRPNYYTGKLLTAEDFQLEQAYHREKNRLRNRLLVGSGVASGLRVAVAGPELVVSPGLAYDGLGHELVLAAEQRQPIPAGRTNWVVVIRYAEVPVGTVPAGEDGAPQPAAIEEVGVVELLATLPCDPPPVVLATISARGSRWRVSAKRRQVLKPRRG